jgi:hypothetical protein
MELTGNSNSQHRGELEGLQQWLREFPTAHSVMAESGITAFQSLPQTLGYFESGGKHEYFWCYNTRSTLWPEQLIGELKAASIDFKKSICRSVSGKPSIRGKRHIYGLLSLMAEPESKRNVAAFVGESVHSVPVCMCVCLSR